MPFRNKLVTTISVGWFLSAIAFFWYGDIVTQLLYTLAWLLLVFGFFSSITAVVKGWHQQRLKSLTPILSIITLVPLAFFAKDIINDYFFRKNFASYASIAKKAEHNYLLLHQPTSEISDLTPEEQQLAFSTAELCDDGSVAVIVITGGGFPAKHFGYLYHSEDTLKNNCRITKDWSIGKKMCPHWYRIKD